MSSLQQIADSQTASLEALVKTNLPPLPGSVARISSTLADMNASQSMIAREISTDPALSTRVLRLANSAFYALHGPVSSLPVAVGTLGNQAISEMLMMTVVNDAFGRSILTSPTGRGIWRHALAAAMVAEETSRLAGLRASDEAFLCGLLHDIGQLIFLRADAAAYYGLLGRVTKGKLRTTDVELEVFGFDHAELGAAAAEAWNLPAVVADIIRCHHDPSKPTSGLAVAHIVDIADQFTYLKNEGLLIDDLMASPEALNLGLTVNAMEDMWEIVAVRLADVLQSFG